MASASCRLVLAPFSACQTSWRRLAPHARPCPRPSERHPAELDDRFGAVYGVSSAQSAGRVPDTVPEKVSAAQVASVAQLPAEIAATALAVLVDRLGEMMQSGALVTVDIPYLGTVSSRGARAEMSFRRELATDTPAVPAEPPVTLGRGARATARAVAATRGSRQADGSAAGALLAAGASAPGGGALDLASTFVAGDGPTARVQPGRGAARAHSADAGGGVSAARAALPALKA